MAGSGTEIAAAALPVDAVLDDLKAAMRRTASAVLVAPPGAGKTTRVPLVLLDEPWAAGGRIILLEPRRLAARAAATRMAQTLREDVGETVGLRVRFGSQIGPRTRIDVVTEGVFARMIVEDPSLDGIAAVIFDEFHERSLDADLGLALALDAQAGLREDLRLLVMSATLDGARVAALMGDAPVIESQGRAYPVETRWRGRDPRRRIEEEVADCVMRSLSADDGSLLVFLPGAGEIRRVETLLRERIADPAIDIAPLYGAMERGAQDLAVRPPQPGRRKIVLATSIAETSLTIDGVRVVIDSGLARVPVYEPDIGLTRLETVRVSRAAADQRRGRAGRTAPGICYRLWEEAAHGALDAFQKPEILSADLSSLLLDCAAFGVTDPTRLPFLDPPPCPALTEARALLAELGALDADGRLTGMGGHLRALALPVRLARMVLAAAPGAAARAASLAALLTERGLGGDAPDLAERLDRFAAERGQRAQDMRRLAEGWARTARALAEGPSQVPADASPGALVALAYPDRIARARGRLGDFVMANGRGATFAGHHGALSPTPLPALANAPFLAIAEIAGAAASARILSAAAITAEEIASLFGDRIEERVETTFDREAKALRARATRRLGALNLAERNLAVSPSAGNAAILARGLVGLGLDALPWSAGAAQLRERVAFLRAAATDPQIWPDLSDSALASDAETWLAPHLIGKTSLSAIDPGLLTQALEALLQWDLRRLLDAEAPTHFEAPTGSRIPIDYSSGEPVVAVRVQELFGLTAHPTLAGGRRPIVLHLTSPAHRPIQITRDLPGFWRGSWADVRSDMRGRYPRHPWPEDPANEAPTRRAKPRGS